MTGHAHPDDDVPVDDADQWDPEDQPEPDDDEGA